MQINVAVTDSNNIVCEVVPPQTQVITIDRGVAGNGIVSIVPVTISTFQYLRITYTNGTVQDVGPLTSTAYTATAPITIVGNTISLATVPIASGGTDATNAADAIKNLLPSYTGNGGKRLGLNSGATALEWVLDGGGTVTSVAASGGTTGLTFSGSPITTSGTLTLGGTLAIASGGTGATTAADALTNLGAIGAITSTDGSVTITSTGTSRDLSVAVAAATTNVIAQVRNATGATLTKGTVVYISGATGQIPTVSKALATSDATSAQTLGMMTADLANNSNGNVTIIGLITNIDTSAYSDGQQLYLSGVTAGAVTATKPYAPIHLVYVAVVEYAHPVNGKLFVKVQNGYELDEIHNVSAQTPSNGQTIVYNSSNSLWENNTVSLSIGVNGTLPIANGGTGQTTANAAFNALAPSQTGNNGKYLTTDGSNTSWATNPLGTVTSVAATVPSFLSISGSPITTSGTLAFGLSGTALPTTSGGTGLTSFTANGVVYASSTSALTTGSALTFNGIALSLNGNGSFTSAVSGNGLVLSKTNVGAKNAIISASDTSSVLLINNSSAGWDSVATYAAGSEGMRLTSTGLGIGTSSPAAKLHVASNATVSTTAYYSSTFGSLVNATSATGVAALGLTSLSSGGFPATGSLSVVPVAGYRSGLVATYSADGGGSGYFAINQFDPNAGTTYERLRVDLSGNLGLGVTSSAWGSYYKAIESTTASEFCITSQVNGIEFGRGYYKINAGFASIYTNGQAPSKYYQGPDGAHSWYSAASGTAGNTVSFTQAMTLTSGGNLLVGTTSGAGRLFVSTAETKGQNATSLTLSTSDSSNQFQLIFTRSTNSYYKIQSVEQGVAYRDIVLQADGGNVGIGTTSPVGKLDVNGNISLSGAGTGARYLALLNETSTYAGSLNIQAGGGSSGFGGGVTLYGHSHATYPGAVWIGKSAGTAIGILFGNGGNGVGDEYMRLNSTGLGIGTSSPQSTLDVYKGTANSKVAYFSSGSSYTADYGPTIVFRNGTSGEELAGLKGAFKDSGQGNYGYLSFLTRTSDGAGITEKMRLGADGNLLLGTVSGSGARLKINVPAAGTAIHATDGTNGDFFVDFPSSSITRLTAEYGGGGNLVFANSTSKTERARINSTGQFLVNTTSDQSGMTNAFVGIGSMGIKTQQASYQQTIDTGIPVNQGSYGGTLMLMVSGHTSDGNSTQSALYLIRFPYNGDYTPTKFYIAGSGDFVTVGTTGSTGSKTLTLYADTIPTYTFFMCT
jgi:hypothetical protein